MYRFDGVLVVCAAGDQEAKWCQLAQDEGRV